MDTEEQGVRRRALRPEVLRAREARKLVATCNAQIGGWQQRLAWLNALARQARPEDIDDICGQAQQILLAVGSERRALLAKIEALPPEMASERTIVDTGRALDSVTTGAERLLALDTRQRPRATHVELKGPAELPGGA